MAVLFLIGGTGNQMFSYVAAHEEDRVSTLLLRDDVRRLLGWTRHERVFDFEAPRPHRHALALLALGLDLVLAKLWRRSLFTEFDIRGLTLSPRVATLVRLGYFQSGPERRSLQPLARQLGRIAGDGTIVLHVRGGDLLALERAGRNAYGLLGGAYHRAALATACLALAQEGRRPRRLLVLTDDPGHAATLDLATEGAPAPEIQVLPLREMLARAVGADWFIASNSTLSYWIVRLREGQRSIAPRPFQKRRDLALPAAARRMPAGYR